MKRFLGNNKGVALLTVMVILAVLMVIIGVLFNMVISERTMTRDYADQKQAYYIAEAAADQAINTFIIFINNLHTDDSYAPDTVNIKDPDHLTSSYIKILDDGTDTVDNPRYDIEQKFITSLGTSDISIDYANFKVSNDETLDAAGYLYDYDATTSTAIATNTLTINIEARFKDEVYPLVLRLRYCRHGAVYDYKGDANYKYGTKDLSSKKAKSCEINLALSLNSNRACLLQISYPGYRST